MTSTPPPKLEPDSHNYQINYHDNEIIILIGAALHICRPHESSMHEWLQRLHAAHLSVGRLGRLFRHELNTKHLRL